MTRQVWRHASKTGEPPIHQAHGEPSYTWDRGVHHSLALRPHMSVRATTTAPAGALNVKGRPEGRRLDLSLPAFFNRRSGYPREWQSMYSAAPTRVRA